MRISDWSSDVCSSDLKGVEFDYRVIGPDAPSHGEELKAHWPVGQFPLLVHDGAAYFESSIIIEYLDHLVPEPRLIPADFDAALKVRFFDRIFDNHVMGRMQAVVADENGRASGRERGWHYV